MKNVEYAKILKNNEELTFGKNNIFGALECISEGFQAFITDQNNLVHEVVRLTLEVEQLRNERAAAGRRAMRAEAIVQRMVPKLQEHYTDAYIRHELMDEDKI